MPNRFPVTERIERARGIGVEALVPEQPGAQLVHALVRSIDVELRPVAGREDDRLLHPGEAEQLRKGPAGVFPRKYDLFAYFYRRRDMVQPKYVQRHCLIWKSGGICWSCSIGVPNCNDSLIYRV
jgi:hypothetical protein